MLNPPLNQLQSQINSKYLIATTAAKRARELVICKGLSFSKTCR